MAVAQRAGPSAVKKAAASVDAPVWRSYLAIRSPQTDPARVAGRSMKRSKPTSATIGGTAGMWLPTPAMAASDASAERVRQYWEQLSASERQQVLFLDEPDLVKQLYKLNLSLLCVGLMQRHLKAKASGAVAVAANGDKTQVKTMTSTVTEPSGGSAQPAAAVAVAVPSSVAAPVVAQAAAKPVVRSLAAADDPSEKTYELLEAMEFMDIGTGILTVKNELVESTDRLFSLVGDVLAGFLSSVHVLTDAQFHSLFVTESEVINTWEDYQRLIAMLVEQLILKSYVVFLEKRALEQMEALLLEESQDDAAASLAADTAHKKKKKKSKKSKKRKTPQESPTTKSEAPKAPSSHTDYSDFADDLDDDNDCRMDIVDAVKHTDELPTPSDAHDSEKPVSGLTDAVLPVTSEEPEPEISCESPSMKRQQERHESSWKGLNPNAAAFHPHTATPAPPASTERKRKLDKFILRVPAEDIQDDEGGSLTCGRVGAADPSSDVEDDDVEDDPDLGRWSKIRRFDDDSELEWQLQQVYASTSALFGWDFAQQRELPEPGASALPWTDATFWRTAPHDVVRYFSPGFGEPFPAHLMPPPPSIVPPPPPHSLYYFSPPPFLPLPAFLPEPPPVARDAFAYHGPVVSSPDFSAPDPGFHRKDAHLGGHELCP